MLTVQNKSVDILKIKDATLSEKIKNVKSEIEIKQKSIDGLTKVCTSLEDNLKTRLSKFDYELPSIENTNSFIKTLEEAIVKYNSTQKNLDVLISGVEMYNSNLSNIEKQLVIHSKTQIDYTKVISKCDTKSTQLKTERIGILPIDITVESKRESLQLVSKQLIEKVESTKRSLQKFLDAKTEKEALKVENSKEQKVLQDTLSTLQSSFGAHIRDSDLSLRKMLKMLY